MLGQLSPLQITLSGGPGAVFNNLWTLGSSRQDIDKRMFRRQNHVRGTEQGVGTRGEDPDRLRRIRATKLNLRALALADPITLHLFDRLRPVERVEVVQ